MGNRPTRLQDAKASESDPGRADLAAANKLRPPSRKLLTEEEVCGAKLTTRDGYCRKTKGQRTDHPGYGNCNDHGGNTEAGVKAAAREMGRDLINTHKAANPQRYRFGGDRRDPSIANLSPEQALV